MPSRKQHFQMKYLLARWALESADRFFTGAPGNFAALWTAVGERPDPADRVPSEGAAASYRPASAGTETVVLVFPRPEVRNEAWFLGLFRTPALRVFCLERSEHPATGAVGTVLAELSPRGRANWGDGGGEDLASFVARVDGVLADPGAGPLSFVELPLG